MQALGSRGHHERLGFDGLRGVAADCGGNDRRQRIEALGVSEPPRDPTEADLPKQQKDVGPLKRLLGRFLADGEHGKPLRRCAANLHAQNSAR